ncbi:MAG: hypothetical protein ACRDAM_08905 [Casimicrobium sp.]
MNFDFNEAEIQSGLDRVRHAEMLIQQIPKPHDGRGTWLLNYGVSKEAQALRAKRKVRWNEKTRSAETVSS